jgi:hypothetical protein
LIFQIQTPAPLLKSETCVPQKLKTPKIYNSNLRKTTSRQKKKWQHNKVTLKPRRPSKNP